MRYLVRRAMRCQSAEELGEKLKRRFDRQRQRRGIARPGRSRDDSELADQLDRLPPQD